MHSWQLKNLIEMKKIGNHNLSMDMNTNKEESLKDSPRIHERKIIGKKLNS